MAEGWSDLVLQMLDECLADFVLRITDEYPAELELQVAIGAIL